MTISLSDAGKRFNREWIFRHFTYTFEPGQACALTGANGSGKSTLLQVISGSMHFNEGSCTWTDQQHTKIAADKVFEQVSICAPYLELVEEMTLREFLVFHGNFKSWLPRITVDSIISELGLSHAADKQIRNFSSGMKQRVKLAQCIFSDTSLLLLDEPCTNLDLDGITLYHRLVDQYRGNRLVIVSSNDEVEYRFCKEKINLFDYK